MTAAKTIMNSVSTSATRPASSLAVAVPARGVGDGRVQPARSAATERRRRRRARAASVGAGQRGARDCGGALVGGHRGGHVERRRRGRRPRRRPARRRTSTRRAASARRRCRAGTGRGRATAARSCAEAAASRSASRTSACERASAWCRSATTLNPMPSAMLKARTTAAQRRQDLRTRRGQQRASTAPRRFPSVRAPAGTAAALALLRSVPAGPN